MSKKGCSSQGKSTYSAPEMLDILVPGAPTETTKKIGCKGAKGGGGGEGSYETKSKISVEDKNGSYVIDTKKEKMSGGPFQGENGTSGVKREYRKRSTIKFGNKDGDTEVHEEEWIYEKIYGYKSSDGSKNLTRYGDYDDYGSYNMMSYGGWRDYGSGYDSGCDSY